MKIQNSFYDWWKINKTAYSALLIDIDGTLIHGKVPFPGTTDFINQLLDENFPFVLLTNDSIMSIKEKTVLLNSIGFKLKEDNIISCGQAISFLVRDRNLQNEQFYIMGHLGTPCFVESSGILVCKDEKQIGNCSGIIIGEIDYDWETSINASVNYLIRNKGGLVIVPNPDSYWTTGNGEEVHVGSGAIGRFIKSILNEYGIAIDLVYLGKPYRSIYEFAFGQIENKFNIKIEDRKRVLAIGDLLGSDIKGAVNMGLTSALVLTGVNKKDHLSEHMSPKPDFIFEKTC
jgi:HAD superfamily hydrolase (TIGR01450 family)